MNARTSGNAAAASKYDSIVIGSGLGGLTSAAYLAAAGRKTLLLEKYDVLGGSSHVFRRKREWEFDVGVHYIGDCGPGGTVPAIMRGLALEDRIEWLPLDSKAVDMVVGPDLSLNFPHGWDQFLENQLLAFPGEEKAIRRYIGALRRIGEAIDTSTTFGSAAGMRQLVRKSGVAASVLFMPVAVFQLACGLSKRAVLANSVHLGAVATTPDVAPVVLLAALMDHFVGRGGWFPKGGGQILAAGFAEVIKSHGGEIRSGVEVARINVEANRAVGVTLADGEFIRAETVVSNIDIKKTYRDLIGLEQLPRSLALRVKSWKMAPPVINAYFGIEYDVRNAPNSNHFIIPNWDRAANLLSLVRTRSDLLVAKRRDPLAWASDLASNIPVYIQTSTRRDPSNQRSAPRGHAAFEAQTMAPFNPRLWGLDEQSVADGSYRRKPQYQEIKQIITQGLLDRVNTAYPGASAGVKWSELATPITQRRYTGATEGNAMGLEPRIGQHGFGRPRSTTPIEGFFIAGTSTAWGPGTQGAMISGVYAAGAILGRDLQSEIRKGTVIADRSRLADWGSDFDPLESTRMVGRAGRRAKADDDRTEDGEAAPVELGRVR